MPKVIITFGNRCWIGFTINSLIPKNNPVKSMNDKCAYKKKQGLRGHKGVMQLTQHSPAAYLSRVSY